MKNKNFKLNIGSTDERDLEEAMERSLQEYGSKNTFGQDKN